MIYPNNYRSAVGWNQFRHFGLPTLYFYKGNFGSKRNLFLNDSIPETTSSPDGYAIGAVLVPPIKAGGMSSYSQGRITFAEGTSVLIKGGPVEGTGSFTLSGDSKNLSLTVGLDGTSTITFSGNGNVLKLTIGLNGTGTFTLSGDSNILSMIVPFEGLGTITFSEGTTNLKGLLSMTGEWTPFTDLSPENLANAVWESAATDHNSSGTMGKIVRQIKTNADLIPAAL